MFATLDRTCVETENSSFACSYLRGMVPLPIGAHAHKKQPATEKYLSNLKITRPC